MNSNLLTTGMIAKLVGCAPRTVGKWIDSGMLPGYRVPTISKKKPGDRRVTKAAFDAFCIEHGIVITSRYETAAA